MSDMRLIVAGAGGRMGRTLIRAIADTKGLTLSGALEDSGSPLLGRNASELAGVGGQDIAITDDAETLLGDADGRSGPARPQHDPDALAPYFARPRVPRRELL